MFVLIFFGKFVWQIYHSKTNWAWYHQTCIISLHVKCPLFLSHLMKHEFPRQIFEKYANIKFNTNPPVGAGLFHADTHTHTHMTKLTVAFRNFANAPENVPNILRLKTLIWLWTWMNTWHMGSTWFTPDLHEVTIGI
jgi:hypothetical protein